MVLSCATVVAVVGAAAFGIQAAVLERPSRGELALSSVARALVRHRLVTSVIRIGGRPPVRGTCLEEWIRGPHGRAIRGAALVLSDGTRLLAARGRPVRVLDGLRLLLAGCPRVVAARAGAALVAHTAIRERLASDAGRRVLTLELSGKRSRLVLLAAPLTDEPVGLRAGLGGLAGTSSIHLVRLTPARAARFARAFGNPRSTRGEQRAPP